MTDLFNLDPTPAPPLEAARRRLKQAEDELFECDSPQDSPHRAELVRRRDMARAEVMRLEMGALG